MSDTSAGRYAIHDEIMRQLRKRGIICPWEAFMPEQPRDKIMGAVALLREEGLATINVGGHAVPDLGRSPTFAEIERCGPAFKGSLTDKGVVVVDEYEDNIIEQYVKNKNKPIISADTIAMGDGSHAAHVEGVGNITSQTTMPQAEEGFWVRWGTIGVWVGIPIAIAAAVFAYLALRAG